MTDNLEAQIIAYCKQRGIPIKDGQVSQEHKAEINEFVKMQDEKAKARNTENNQKISEILKKVLPRMKQRPGRSSYCGERKGALMAGKQ